MTSKFLFALFLCISVFLIIVPVFAEHTIDVVPICTAEYRQTQQDIYEDKIVWADTRGDYSNIYLYNLSNGTESLVAYHASSNQIIPKIYDDGLCFLDDRFADGYTDSNGNWLSPNWNYAAFTYNLSTGIEELLIPIPDSCHPEYLGDFYGDTLTYLKENWTVCSGDEWDDEDMDDICEHWRAYDIFIYDTATRTEQDISLTLDQDDCEPSIWGNKIVYTSSDDAWKLDYFNLSVYDISTCSKILIKTGSGSANYLKYYFSPDIYENLIVYSYIGDIYLYDLNIGIETQITHDSAWQRCPKIYGNFIIWVEGNPGPLYLYDLHTEEQLQVATNVSMWWGDPEIYKNKIIWEDGTKGYYDTDVYMAVIDGDNPYANFDCIPNPAPLEEEITFDASSSTDSNGTIVKYEWEFGDGTTGSGQVVLHTYYTEGVYTVNLTVTDDTALTGSISKTLVVGQLLPEFSYSPQKIRITDPVNFDASLSVGAIEEYQWDFGDNTPTATGLKVTHQYQKVGEYNVTLTVSDDKGHSAEIKNPVKITIPVILVHGWNAGPGTWSALEGSLKNDGYQVFNFDYQDISSSTDPRIPAWTLKNDINSYYRKDLSYNGLEYKGKFDIVAHSMGALVTRYYMEELDGYRNVRQWIGVAPVNHGSATADFAQMAPDWVKSVINTTINLDSIFHLRTDSPAVKSLNNNDIRDYPLSSIKYRVIGGYNGAMNPYFLFSAFGGKTWEYYIDKNGVKYYYLTWMGDGIVSQKGYVLEGAEIDYVPYDHLMTDKPLVINKVKTYIQNISISSSNTIPWMPPAQIDIFAGVTRIDLTLKSITKPLLFILIGSHDLKALFRICWLGSDVNMTLISPSGERIGPDSDKVTEYLKTNTSIYYIIDYPEPGEWKAEIDPVDIPPEGEPVTFTVFVNSSLTMTVGTTENSIEYLTGDSPVLIATLKNDTQPIIGARVWVNVTSPDNSVSSLSLWDEGTHGDAVGNDGIYSVPIPLPEPGYYSCIVATDGTVSEPFQRTGELILHAGGSETICGLIDLYPGWNFISVARSLRPGYDTPDLIFTSVDSGGRPIWRYDSEFQEWVQVNESTVLHSLDGYWIYSTGFYDVPVFYDPSMITIPAMKHLSLGWNAIGPGSASPILANRALYPLGDSWSVVLQFDNGLQMYLPPIVHGDAETSLNPGQGYWIYMKESGDLVAMTG